MGTLKEKNFEELRKNMTEEAIRALTMKPVATYSSERVRLWSEIASEVESIQPQPLRYGNALKRFLSKVSIPVCENDILIGRMIEESFDESEEKAFREKYITPLLKRHGIPTFITDAGHQSFRWRDIINTGLPAMKSRAEEYVKIHEDTGNKAESDFTRGAVMIYEAIINFINRSADAAEAAGLHESAEACRKAASGAPDSLHSALQLIWSIEFIFCAYIAPNPTLALGRLDLFLNEIYEKEISEGKIDRDFAALLIDEFYAKNNLIMGRGEHQESERSNSPNCTGWHRILCYDSPQYLILSGIDPDSEKTVANSLTELFIERINPKYKNPVIVFRYTRDFAEKHSYIWNTLVKKMRDSASAMIYNDISACAMYEKSGDSRYDALSHEYFGCNKSTLPAKDQPNYEVIGFAMERLMLPILIDAITDACGNDNTFDRSKVTNSVYKHFYDKVKTDIVPNFPIKNTHNPNLLRFYSCFAYDNIENGGLYFEKTDLVVPFGGIANLIDSLAALDHLANEKGIPPQKVLEACKKEYEGEDVIRMLCKNAPKLGDGHPTSSYWAGELPRTLIRAFKDACGTLPPHLKLRFLAENDTWHMRMGDEFAASPDGRRKGEPIAQNFQPSSGSAKNGITAMLSSLTNMPFDDFIAGALNVTIQPKNFEGEDGLDNLARIISVYFEKGGLQIQLSSVDKELLLDAQKNPDMHRDLMVRVTGYSAVFVDMCKKAQDDLISRNTF